MAWGIDDSYFDISGRTQVLPPAVRLRLMEAMGLPPDAGDHPPPVPLRFAGPGRSRALDGRGVVHLEDGSDRSVQDELPADLPAGYHRLSMDGGEEEIRLFVTPRACLLPRRRMAGFSAQLYAARSQRSWGIGDLADLELLLQIMKRDLGLDALLLNPLGAVPPIHPQESSPYSPSSRRFLNPIYLAIEDVPGARESLDLEQLSREGRSLSDRPMIDRDAIYELKIGALRRIWEKTRPVVEADGSLARFASYCALAEIHGPDWRRWPEGLRRHDSNVVAHFCAEHRDRVGFFAWLQALLDRQLAAASTGGVILDLPIGFRSDGADAWEWQDLLALTVSIGAPPDAFNLEGQDWGLPPFIPHKLRAAFYQPFIETLRAMFRRSAGLRIDHVMGLFRLFWVPHGLGAKNGGYVRFQSDELLDILAIESHRAGAFVIGEDLGTVEEGVRETLFERNILSCRLLWFEPVAPEHWPERALGSVTTHDLPMIAGVWNGTDRAPELRERLRDWGQLPDDAPVERAIEAACDLLKRSPSLLRLMQIEDAFASGQRPNVPGTTDRPNWCLPLPAAIEALADSALAKRLGAALATR
jgi:4-alpha-glucanotransferase